MNPVDTLEQIKTDTPNPELENEPDDRKLRNEK